MFRRLSLLLLLPLTACGIGSFGNSGSATASDLSGNWQIQSAQVTTPLSGLLLLGALQSQGSAVTGTFRLTDLDPGNACTGTTPTVITLSGQIDAGRNLTLVSTPFAGSVLTLKLLVLPSLTSFSGGTLQIAGPTCNYAQAAAIGGMIASVTGTFTGSLPASANSITPTTGTDAASLKLTQAATPAADGQFPLTGTLAFSSGTCTQSQAVTGTVSGVGLTLFFPTSNPLVTYNAPAGLGTVNNTATQILNLFVIYAPSPCSATLFTSSTYTGTLTRQ